MDYPIERIIRTGLDDHVDMIGHDAPGQKAITPTVEMEQCRLDKLRDVRPTQPTCTKASIQLLIGLDKVVGKRSDGLGNSLRQAVTQAERHELDNLW